jgi:hypothetical protein
MRARVMLSRACVCLHAAIGLLIRGMAFISQHLRQRL